MKNLMVLMSIPILSPPKRIGEYSPDLEKDNESYRNYLDNSVDNEIVDL